MRFPITPEAIDSYYQQHIDQYQQAKIKVIYIPYAGQVASKGTDYGSSRGRRETGSGRRPCQTLRRGRPQAG